MMNPDGGKIREGIKAEWCARDCPVVGESSWWGEWLKAASHVKIGGMPFWKDKFKGREGGKNLCAAIIVLLTESVPELPIWGLHVLLSSPFYVWEPRRVTVPLAPGNACGYWLPPWTLRGVYQFSSVQFSRSVVSDSLWPHGPQHARPPCSSPTPGVYSNSCLLSRWCHPTISSSVNPFSSRLQSCPASGSFPMSQFFASGGQSIGASASASVLPMNIQSWFPLGWTGWISLQFKGLSRVFSNTTVQKHQFFSTQLSL